MMDLLRVPRTDSSVVLCYRSLLPVARKFELVKYDLAAEGCARSHVAQPFPKTLFSFVKRWSFQNSKIRFVGLPRDSFVVNFLT